MFKDFQWTTSVYLWIDFLRRYKGALKCYQLESRVIVINDFYWHPAFNVNCRPMKLYWWINRLQKLHQNIIFSNWNVFIYTIILFFFIQTTDITAHPNINGNLICFLWMETGCMLGSPDKFENDKLYSNATTQQNEREPGIVLDSKKNIGFLTMTFIIVLNHIL